MNLRANEIIPHGKLRNLIPTECESVRKGAGVDLGWDDTEI